jgi:hypothetical protein
VRRQATERDLERAREYKRENAERVRVWNKQYWDARRTEKQKSDTAYRCQPHQRDKMKIYNQGYKRARVEKHKAILDEAKSVPCTDCGQNYPPFVMDFDHVRGTKVRGVGEMRLYSTDRLIAEIAKCEVVCANCHRIRTFTRLAQKSQGAM